MTQPWRVVDVQIAFDMSLVNISRIYPNCWQFTHHLWPLPRLCLHKQSLTDATIGAGTAVGVCSINQWGIETL